MFEYLANSANTKQIYMLTNSALAVIELDKIAKLIAVPVRELRKLPRRIQEQMCGAYAMEFDKDSTNTELVGELRGMMQQ